MRTTRKLKAKLEKWYSWDHVILDGTHEVTRLRLSAFRNNGTVVIGEIEYQFGREKTFGGPFYARSDTGVDAKAEKPSIFRDSYVVSYDNLALRLRRTSLIKGTYGLFEKDKEVGTIAREGFFSRTTIIKLPDDVPLPVAIFLFWLVLYSRQRRSRSA